MKHAYTWGAILAIVLASTTGDVLLSRAMKRVGDVGELWRRSGLLTVAGRILSSPSFLLGIFMMAMAFYSLLFALSWADVSLVAPASASLTFVANAIAARIFLHERVDHRRWIAALLVAGGRGAAGSVGAPASNSQLLPLPQDLRPGFILAPLRGLPPSKATPVPSLRHYLSPLRRLPLRIPASVENREGRV